MISDAHGLLWLTEARSIMSVLISNAFNSSSRISAAKCRQVWGIGKSINYLYNGDDVQSKARSSLSEDYQDRLTTLCSHTSISGKIQFSGCHNGEEHTALFHLTLINWVKDTGKEAEGEDLRGLTVLFLPCLQVVKEQKPKGVFGTGGEQGGCLLQPNSNLLHFSMTRKHPCPPSSLI